MTDQIETALFKANVLPVRGRQIFWLISKTQLEHVVTDAEVVQSPSGHPHVQGIAHWQGLSIPVIDLEKFYNFKLLKDVVPQKRALVKTLVEQNSDTVQRFLVNIPYDIRLVVLSEECKPARVTQEELDKRGLLGVYEWEKDKLLLVPDLSRIARFGN
ncbi:MAG: hypothetical protein D6B25_08570 [Desulfobulbaceae bacterium]|nr:MAG: hypothetical protein D6B25_08570 [Desulfobulbaceae bacterium]